MAVDYSFRISSFLVYASCFLAKILSVISGMLSKMKRKPRNLQRRLYLITAIILVVGLSNAILIYLTTENVSEDVLVYQFEHSKKYRHDLELIGGKANVLADDFYRWFGGLWHGKSLAFIVAFITVVISSGFFFVAYHLPPDSRPDARG